MLNGVAPLLIFTFYNKGITDFLSGIPVIGDDLAETVGLPVPIYLDEKLTGIYVDSETRAIDIETNVQPRYDGKPPIVDQSGLNSLITVNMFANHDSVLLTTLLALSDFVLSKVVSKEYRVTYINGPTVVIGGLLHGFSTQTATNDDLIRITMQISKANQTGTQPASVISVLPKITGALPISG